MSTTMDTRVVEMQFDNQQFERNIHTSMNSLDGLKKSLKMDGVSDGLEEVTKASKKLDFHGMIDGLEQAVDRFNGLGTVAGKTLEGIKNYLSGLEMQALRFVKSLSFDQISAGMTKYEEKMTAVRTIMAAGYDMDTVDKYLTRLNKYTDMTSYNFTEMASTIGKFTAAGVDLGTAERAMEGIANWAARSGVNAQNASPAFYNLAQAIGTGSLKLQDWKSIENANMATKEFKQTLIDEAVAAGTLSREWDEATQSYRYYQETTDSKGKKKRTEVTVEGMSQTLSGGWATSDVVLATLDRYYQGDLDAGQDEIEALTRAIAEKEEAIRNETDATKKQRLEEERLQLVEKKQALESYQAAKEARSFTDVLNALKDAVSTGWMSSFELIFGNVEEAAAFFTGICDTIIDDVITPIQTARNRILEGWNFLGGRDSMITSLQNLWEVLKKLAHPIGEAFNSIFGKESITVFNTRFKDITDTGVKYLTDSFSYYGSDLSNFVTIDGWSVTLANLTKKVELFTKKMVAWFDGEIVDAEGNVMTRTQALVKGFSGLFATLNIVKNIIVAVAGKIKSALSPVLGGLVDKFLGIFAKFGDKMVELNSKLTTEGISKFIDDVIAAIKKFFGFGGKAVGDGEEMAEQTTSIFGQIGALFDDGGILSGIKNFVLNLIDTIKNLTGAADGVDLAFLITAVLGGVLIFKAIGLVKKVSSVVGTVSDVISSVGDGLEGIIDKIKSRLGGSKGKGETISIIIKNIALALASVASAVYMISRINPDNLIPALLATVALLGVMIGAAFLLNKMAKKMDAKDTVKMTAFSAAMIVLGEAVKIFAKAVQIMGNLGLEGALVGVGALTIIMAELLIFIKLLSRSKTNLDIGALGILGMLGDVVKKFAQVVSDLGKLDSKTLAKGILGLTVIIIEMVAIIKMVNGAKFTAGSGIGLILLGVSVNMFAKAIKKIGSLNTDTILKGVIGLGAVLLELVIFMKLTQKMKSGFGQFAGLLLLAVSVNLFAKAIKKIGSLDTETIIKGVAGLGAVLLELVIFMALTKKLKSGFTQFAGLLMLAVSVNLFAKAIKKIGELETEQVVRGVLGLGAVLLELVIFMKLTQQMKAGFGRMAGLLILALAVNQFAKAISTLGHLDTAAIVKGLLGLGGVLLELLVFMKIMDGSKVKLSNFIGIMLLAVAVKSFVNTISTIGDMNTAALVKGLIGLGAVLLELIIFIKLTQKAKFGVGQGVALLGLGVTITLFARAMKKIGDMSWEQILKGIIGLGAILIEMAAFTKVLGALDMKSTAKTMVVLVVMGAALLGFTLLMQSLGDVDTMKMLAFSVSFGVALLAFTAAVAILGAIPFTVVLAGLAKIAIILAAVIGIAALVGYIEQETGVSSLINKFGDVMEAIGVAIGRFIGGIGKGIISGFKDAMDDFKLMVTTLGEVMVMLNGIKVNEGAVENVGKLVGVMTAIAGYNIVDALSSWLTGQSSIGKFSDDIQQLGSAITAYADLTSGLSKVNMTAMNRATDITTGLVDTVNALPKSGGLVQKLTGAHDLGAFAEDIPKLGDALGSYATSVGTIKGVNMNQIKNVTNVAQGIADLTEHIPKTGGLAQLIMGTTDMDKFTEFIPSLGAAMAAYITYVTPNMKTKVEQSAVEAATAAATGIAELTEHIPKTGGLLQFLTGAANLEEFAKFIPALGSAMAAYIENIGDGYDKPAKNLENVKTAAEGVASLAAAIPGKDFCDLLAAWTGADNTDKLTRFTNFIPALGSAMATYIENIGDGYNKPAKNIENVKTAAEGVAALAAAIPGHDFLDLIAKWTGADDTDKLTRFTAFIPALGTAMSAYADNVSSAFAEKTVSSGAAQNATEAAKGLAELTQNLPRTYGLKQVYEGEVDYDSFVEFLPKLGKGLKAYADQIKTGELSKIVESGDNTNAIAAATSLADFCTKLPRAYGLKQVYEGEVDYDSFTTFLPKLGSALRAYAEELNKEGWQSFSPETSEKAISAATALADLATKLPDTGGLVQKIMGEKHLDTFAEDIKAIGEGLGSFASSVSGVELGDADTAVSVMGVIQEFIGSMKAEGGIFNDIGEFFGGSTKNSLLNLTANMKTVGENLNSFATNISSADFSNLEAVKKVMTDMREFINTLDVEGGLWRDIGEAFGGKKDITITSSKMKTFGNDFAAFATGISGAAQAATDFESVKTIISALTEFAAQIKNDEIDWTDIEQAAWVMANYFTTEFMTGITNATTDVKTTTNTMATDASEAEQATKDAYYNTGKNLGTGLGNGIAAMAATVKRQAQLVAAGALNQIRITWSVRSPSKEAAKLGNFFDLGLASGLSDYAGRVTGTVENVAEDALDSAREAFLRGADGSIFDYIDPNPTIRPVLDMTDVESAMAGFDSDLGRTRSFGLFSGRYFSDHADSLEMSETGRLGGSDNSDVVGELQTLEELIGKMNDEITNMQLVLDTGALVGGTTSAYDQSLGRRVGYSRRGMKT